MQTKDLLPCPFCGGEAKLLQVGGIRHPWSSVEACALATTANCVNCGATIPSRMAETDAIAAWNARAERTCRDEWEIGFLCSECGTAISGLNSINYCPNCGRKVVG